MYEETVINSRNLLVGKILISFWYLLPGMVRFQILTDDQTRLLFEVKKDNHGNMFLRELNKAIAGELIFSSIELIIISKIWPLAVI